MRISCWNPGAENYKSPRRISGGYSPDIRWVSAGYPAEGWGSHPFFWPNNKDCFRNIFKIMIVKIVIIIIILKTNLNPCCLVRSFIPSARRSLFKKTDEILILPPDIRWISGGGNYNFRHQQICRKGQVRELTLQVQAIREDIESWKAKEAMAENREIIYEHETDGQVRLDYIYFVTYIDYSWCHVIKNCN